EQNAVIESRWDDVQYDRLPGLAADLVRRRVSVIVVLGNYLAVQAAKAATTTIPIVFAIGTDPVRMGLVNSFNRPGGNVTGATSLSPEALAKRLQLLHELVPSAKVFGILRNPDTARGSPDPDLGVRQARDTVSVWGGRVEVATVRTASELGTAFATLAE